MADIYKGNFTGFLGPYSYAAQITPSDSTVFDPYLLALFIGGAGNLNVLLRGMTTPVIIPVVATVNNQPWQAYIKQILATGTTATGLIGFW